MKLLMKSNVAKIESIPTVISMIKKRIDQKFAPGKVVSIAG